MLHAGSNILATPLDDDNLSKMRYNLHLKQQDTINNRMTERKHTACIS